MIRVLVTSPDHASYGRTGVITGAAKMRGEKVYSVKFADGSTRFLREGQFTPTKVQND